MNLARKHYVARLILNRTSGKSGGSCGGDNFLLHSMPGPGLLVRWTRPLNHRYEVAGRKQNVVRASVVGSCRATGRTDTEGTTHPTFPLVSGLRQHLHRSPIPRSSLIHVCQCFDITCSKPRVRSRQHLQCKMIDRMSNSIPLFRRSR